MKLANLKNKELLTKFSHFVAEERKSIVRVILWLSEIYRRRLYAEEGYASLFAYLTEHYRYSGGAAYRRIQAAKAYLRFPEVLKHLQAGQLTLMTISLIEPNLKQANGTTLIQQVLGKSKRDVEDILSQRFSRPSHHEDKIRKLPSIKRVESSPVSKSTFTGESGLKTTSEIPHFARNDQTKTQEIHRVKIEFVADEKIAKKIERAKQILRHKFPKARLEDIFNQALDDMLEKRDPNSHSERKARRISRNDQEVKRKSTRYIPKSMQREVWRRDKGHCTFISNAGKQCDEKSALEMDHIQPWALGGPSTSVNLRLLCRTHNQFRSQKTFGFSFSPVKVVMTK